MEHAFQSNTTSDIGVSKPDTEILRRECVQGFDACSMVCLMSLIVTQSDRTDLPLVVMPSIIPSMTEPFKAALPVLHDIARVSIHDDATLDENVIVDRCAGADAVMVIGFHVSESMFTRLADHVRCFSFGGTGVASYIDLARAREQGIAVTNVVRYGDHAVAEHAFALIMELSRQVGRLDSIVRSGGWSGVDGIGLHGKTLGLVGFGGIAQAVSDMASGFGMPTLVWNSHLHADAVASHHVTPVDDLGDLLHHSDVVSIHLPLTTSTRGIITSEHLNRLRPGTIIVNTARAEVIRPGALADRLLRGDLLAGLDVFDKEPLPQDDPLRSAPGTILTPHVAWRDDEAYRALSDQVVRAIAGFFTGSSVNRVV